MKTAIILLIIYTIQCLPSPRKRDRYRNINALAASFWILLSAIAIDILISVFSRPSYTNDSLYNFLVIQTVILLIVKIVSASKDSDVKYGIPMKYTSGWRYSIISIFYATEDRSAIIYTRESTKQIGIVALLCESVLFASFIYQSTTYTAVGNTLFMPFSAGAFLAFIIEFSIFCLGESRWDKLVKQYNSYKNCKNRRELAKVRFSSFTDFSFIFMKNFVWEPLHILRATKFNWKKHSFESSIKYYDFASRYNRDYDIQSEQNPELEDFIKSNNLDVNRLYLAAFNLIDRNQNVLIKTPSYVEFEPYLISMIKMKVAKTQKIVLVVSNEEKKLITKKKIHNAFSEYMGFDEIPLMLTIDECIKRMPESHEEENAQNVLSHFDDLTNKGYIEIDTGDTRPVKSPDIIIISPEDVCDSSHSEFIRSVIKNLGLIIYYDFSDSVQEEALFAKIVHAVLDYDDRISTLYMADSFFDLEQVVDNFFSKRNIYKIVVPRKPSEQSYVMGWKSENINEMQSRTFPDASRDVGNHIPILYDAGGHTENDLMIVEDEFDAYAENRMNFSDNELSSRFDFHVGWTDVIGGNSVMCTVSDTYNNVAHTYLAMSGIGSKSEYINIISRPYLLRNYLMYHLRFFTLYPGVLSSYSPGLIKTPKAWAYEAVVKLFVAGCTKEQLSNYIDMTALPCKKVPEDMINALLTCAGYKGVPTITQNAHDRYFIDAETYRIIIDKSGLIEKIEFVTNRHVYVRNKRDYSYLIPHQKIVLDGVKYTIEKISGNRVELTDSNTREPIFIMRPIRSCKVKVNDVEDFGSHIQNNSKSSISFRRLIADVELDTYGNIVFKDSYHPFCDDARYDYQTISESRKKSYSDINLFNIKIGSHLITAENRDRISHLFALLLNEMLPTFFPRHSKRIIIGCSGWTISPDFESQNISPLHSVAQMDIDNFDQGSDNEISLYILEDSPVETGLVNVFWQDEEFRYMLKVLEDYLYYQKIINRRERREIFAPHYIKDLSLLKRILLEVINETFEIENENSTIDAAFYNSIRSSRNKFNNLEITHSFDITCDFCGRKIISKHTNSINYHYYAYSGLVSCPDCYASAICGEKRTQAEIHLLEDKINEWFLKQYKDYVTTNFYNYLEDTERVLEISSIKDRLVITDDFDYGVVEGLSSTGEYKDDISVFANTEAIAITDERINPNESFRDVTRASYLIEDIGRAFILIKDGLPYNYYMGVLAHEMTHQWQFANLDFYKLRIGAPSSYTNEFEKVEDLQDFRIEGMAEWERIRYIRKHFGIFMASREARKLRAARNAYGYGYIWMCNFMKVGHDDPTISVPRTFSFIMKRNYYQFTKNSFALMRLYFGKLVPVTDTESEPESTAETEQTAETE